MQQREKFGWVGESAGKLFHGHLDLQIRAYGDQLCYQVESRLKFFKAMAVFRRNLIQMVVDILQGAVFTKQGYCGFWADSLCSRNIVGCVAGKGQKLGK